MELKQQTAIELCRKLEEDLAQLSGLESLQSHTGKIVIAGQFAVSQEVVVKAARDEMKKTASKLAEIIKKL